MTLPSRFVLCATLVLAALPASADLDHDHGHGHGHGDPAPTPTPAVPAAPAAPVEVITAQQAGTNVYMLTGQGGNIGVFVGPENVLMIDSQFAPLTPEILAAIQKISDKPVATLINTHWHFDHTGGNENLGNQGVEIVAHENVHKRLATDQHIVFFDREVPALKPVGQPDLTYQQAMSFYLGEETLDLIHLPAAHTDGDTAIYFRHANVLHTGDLYFANQYPFIDTSSGGDIQGLIAAVTTLLTKIDDQTVVIPGHGSISNQAELAQYLAMLIQTRDNVQTLIDGGKTLEQIQAAHPTADFDQTFGQAMINPEAFVGILHDSLTRPNP